MPLPGDLNRARLYKIVYIPNPIEIYIGSTTQKYLANRMGSHKHNALHGRKGRDKIRTPFEQYMFENGVENFKIFLIPKDLSNIKNREELENIEFDTMREYEEKGYIILNYCKNKDDIKKYLSEARKKDIKNNPNMLKKFRNFNYGTVRKDDYGCWRFSWWDNDEKRTKSKAFSSNKYGEEDAKKMAEEMRFKVFGITEDEYKDWLKNRQEENLKKEEEKIKKEEKKLEEEEKKIEREEREFKRKEEIKNRIHPGFKFGYVGKAEKGWRFQYSINGKRKTKYFAFAKNGGIDNAYKLLIEFRKFTFPSYQEENNND